MLGSMWVLFSSEFGFRLGCSCVLCSLESRSVCGFVWFSVLVLIGFCLGFSWLLFACYVFFCVFLVVFYLVSMLVSIWDSFGM